MITRAQTKKIVMRLEAHLAALKEIRDGLKAHHQETEALTFLEDAIRGLDSASDALNEEVG